MVGKDLPTYFWGNTGLRVGYCYRYIIMSFVVYLPRGRVSAARVITDESLSTRLPDAAVTARGEADHAARLTRLVFSRTDYTHFYVVKF